MKKNPYHWFFGIPEFNAAHMFTYLEDLARVTNNKYYSIYIAKQTLYANATAAVSNAVSSLSQDSDNVSNALSFLKNVADNERNKELHIIKEYEQQLREMLPPNDTTINKLLSKLNGDILNKPDELEEFYNLLTKYINEVRQTNLEYQNRLRQLEKHQKEHQMQNLPQDNYLFRAAGDITSMFHQLQRNALGRQKDKADSFAERVRNTAAKYILESGLLDQLSSGEDIMAAFALVLLDVEQKFQKALNQNHFNDFTEFLENDALYEEVVNNYFQADMLEETRLQKAITKDAEDLEILLDDAKKVLGIRELGMTGEDAEARTKAEEQARKRKDENQKLYQKLKQQSNNSALEDLKYITFSTSSNGIHGNIFELVQEMLSKSTINIRGNVATDLITLGSFSFDISPDSIQSKLMTHMSNIEKTLTDFDKQKRNDRKDDQTKRYARMNKTIKSSIEKLEKQAKKLIPEVENLFVYHESLKLYKTAESNKDFKSFSGRDMVILNYIDEMYSANGIGLDLPEKQNLQLLAMNLSSQAVGGDYKGTLENFFSIFAGLLMFDDVQNMAQEAQNALLDQNNHVVKQIHLYNLNGIYVPASMILSFTYNLMSQAQITIEQEYAVKATISTSGADDAISAYLAKRPLPLKPQWTNLGEAVATGTHVRIHLLAGFANLIEQLSKI